MPAEWDTRPLLEWSDEEIRTRYGGMSARGVVDLERAMTPAERQRVMPIIVPGLEKLKASIGETIASQVKMPQLGIGADIAKRLDLFGGVFRNRDLERAFEETVTARQSVTRHIEAQQKRLDEIAARPIPERPEVGLLRELLETQRLQAEAASKSAALQLAEYRVSRAHARRSHRWTRVGVVAAVEAAVAGVVALATQDVSTSLTVVLSGSGALLLCLAWLDWGAEHRDPPAEP